MNNVDFGRQHRLRAAALLLGLSFCSRVYATVQKINKEINSLLGYVEVPLTAGRLFADRAGLFFFIALINHGRLLNVYDLQVELEGLVKSVEMSTLRCV